MQKIKDFFWTIAIFLVFFLIARLVPAIINNLFRLHFLVSGVISCIALYAAWIVVGSMCKWKYLEAIKSAILIRCAAECFGTLAAFGYMRQGDSGTIVILVVFCVLYVVIGRQLYVGAVDRYKERYKKDR